jgi:hypothetical protein
MKKTITVNYEADIEDDSVRYDFSATDGEGGFLMLDTMIRSSDGRTDGWEDKIRAKWGQNVEIRSFINMP